MKPNWEVVFTENERVGQTSQLWLHILVAAAGTLSAQAFAWDQMDRLGLKQNDWNCTACDPYDDGEPEEPDPYACDCMDWGSMGCVDSCPASPKSKAERLKQTSINIDKTTIGYYNFSDADTPESLEAKYPGKGLGAALELIRLNEKLGEEKL